MTTIVASAALGYVAFWAYFASRTLGRVFSCAVMAAAFAVTIAMLKRQPAARVMARSMAVPLGYVAAVGACYTCLLFLYQDPWSSGAECANVRFFRSEAPGDNQIPLIFAERIYAQKPVEPFCCGDWRSSDRPPLQAGIFLLQRPFKLFGNVRLNYQLLGTGLQCVWICGVWVLLKSLGALSHEIRQILGFLVFSPFLFYNSVYVWPKLLAAAFVLFTFGILFEAARKGRQVTWFETGLAALSFALALLAHPGSAFSAPALLFVSIRNRQLWSARKAAASAVLIAVLFAPWIAYQKFYDPPGNRLLKMHLAGVGQINSRSTWQAIRDSYSSKSLATIARDKWENLRTLMGPNRLPHGWEDVRVQQREYLCSALGVLAVGFVVLALAAWGNIRLGAWGTLFTMAVLNLVVCSLVLIGPGFTVTTHLSYADVLLLATALIGRFPMFPRLAALAIFAVQILNLFFVWVFVKPALIAGNHLQWPLALMGLASATVLAWHFGKAIWQPPPASPHASPECPLRY